MKELIKLIQAEPNYYTLKQYHHNEVIFLEGDTCQKIGIILSGQVKITSFLTDREDIINLLSKEEMFGDALLFSNDPIYLGTATAKLNTSIVYLTKKQLFHYCLNPTFLELYLKEIADKTLSLKKLNKLYTYNKIRDKLLYYFLTLSKQTKSKTIYLASITKLAELFNIPRPSISRELSKMEKDHLIIKNKKYITLL